MTSPKDIMTLLDGIPDPEIPVISIVELGMVKNVTQDKSGKVIVTITPTYSGCPALYPIKETVAKTLREAGYQKFEIQEDLYPPWTTDSMTEKTREKLKKYGIAPPKRSSLAGDRYDYSDIACPRCESKDTQLVNMFGSTPCKALLKCNTCLEPFEHFKCH